MMSLLKCFIRHQLFLFLSQIKNLINDTIFIRNYVRANLKILSNPMSAPAT